MSQEDDPRDPGQTNAEEPPREQGGPMRESEQGGPTRESERGGPTRESEQAGASAQESAPSSSREPEQNAPSVYGDAFGEIEDDAPPSRSFAGKSNPTGGPRLQAVPPHEPGKRRPEFQAGSDLSDLLAKKQLDFDTELRRRPEVRSVEFQQVGDDGEAAGNSLDMLMDIRLPIAVELGRTQMLVRDILDYGPGTVIELDKLAGDPVDVLVNGKIVAQGEVVVADDHFGVRITVLLSPQDRVRSLA
jgi:flagellar motor switch protein FliN